ncbi:DUF1697 domain-containing protein [Cohnella sp.]|uniref:DUF1697 domain-containing protein n=1 Tax=Cohnella sp. TaxID=1883426 RepID=UPI00356525E4
MTTYIAFLRGINVGGHKKIKMDHLKNIFEALKFENVRTYIQSGNVVFEATEQDGQTLVSKIVQAIEKGCSFQVPVLIRTVEELEMIILQNPYDLEMMNEKTQSRGHHS